MIEENVRISVRSSACFKLKSERRKGDARQGHRGQGGRVGSAHSALAHRVQVGQGKGDQFEGVGSGRQSIKHIGSNSNTKG